MIELRNITKSFPALNGRHYVFRDLSFSFPDDVSVGLIGPNGAGKSTLLRMICGIDKPERGSIVSNAAISWPVGLKRGLQGSITGRDNVKFVCRVYGATGDAMKEKMKFVQEFAGIGEHFDLPVKTYSTGMRSRLAFGMSMAFDFDYYLIDEVTAVGDAAFRRKCGQMFEWRLEKSNLILVSHNMNDIRQWCDVVVLVQDGAIILYDDVEEGIVAYQGPPDAAVSRRRRRRAARLMPEVPAPTPAESPAPAAPTLAAKSTIEA